jgi:hypothetical protein
MLKVGVVTIQLTGEQISRILLLMVKAVAGDYSRRD